jgi:pimeloyl-ACP methyl ester carboxylesterase
MRDLAPMCRRPVVRDGRAMIDFRHPVPRKRLLAVIVAAAAALTVACAPATADPPPAAIAWTPCPDGAEIGMECAALDVPVDPADPEGRRITLQLGRLPATGPAEGSVLTNFGGPGPSGIEMLRKMTHGSFTSLRERMHIVTWDPRGYGGPFGGRSTALDCDWTTLVRPTPPYPADQAEFDALAAANRATAAACRDTDPTLFDHMDSASNAWDLEAIRVALGDPELNFYGSSYGGMIGQAYARLFPDRIRTMVLDGTSTHSTGDWASELDALARDQEALFQRFVDWCAAEPSCALHGSDVGDRWQKVLAQADRTPVPAPAVDAAYTRRDLQALAMNPVRRGPEGWPALAQAVVAAEQGDASGFAPPGRWPYPSVGTPGVTECLEFPSFTDIDELTTTVERITTLAPNTGAAFPLVAHIVTCIGWPAPLSNPPAPLPDGVPPLLGAGTWSDYPGTDRVIDQVPGSVSILHDGPGHVLYANGNTCVIDHANRYFLEKDLPADGTTC